MATGTLLPVFAAVTVYFMARAISIIEQEIRALSSSDKEQLLHVLLEEFDGQSDADADAAWLEESQRRSPEIDAGTVKCVPADEVFTKVDALLKR
ncbi:MAG: addiction module protein [Steroidobacteraceae bacterium]